MKAVIPTIFHDPHRLLGLALLAAVPLAAWSQQVVPGAATLDAEEAETVRRYAVEVIVFEYTDQSSAGTEIFTPAEAPPLPGDEYLFGDDPTGTTFGHDDRLNGASEAEPIFTDTPMPDPGTPPAVRLDGEIIADDTDVLLPPAAEVELTEISTYEHAGLKILGAEDYVLDAAYERLQALDAYRPIMRAAWTQPTLEKDQSMPITLRRLGDPPLRLDGTMTLYLSRFLHLVVDLELEEKAPQQGRVADGGDRRYDDKRSRFGFGSAFETRSTFYRIEEDRIVRNGELRYFDHPRFGVLAKIWRIETADPAAETIGLFGQPRPAANQN